MPTTFDGPNLRIILDPTETDIDVERDLYSEWKVFVLVGDNSKFPPAFRTIGGDPLNPSLDAGSYFFLQNQDGWRIRPGEADNTVQFTGNLAAEDVTLPLTVPTLGAFTVLLNGLQPITQGTENLLSGQQAIAVNTTLTRKIVQNRNETNPITGVQTIYDDDDSILLQGDLFDDVAGTVLYNVNSTRIDRRNRLV